jgi:hypothetical protein
MESPEHAKCAESVLADFAAGVLQDVLGKHLAALAGGTDLPNVRLLVPVRCPYMCTLGEHRVFTPWLD